MNPPFVLVRSDSTKNRKTARQYIQHELAAELANLVRIKLGGAPAFNMPSKFDIADMLRADLQQARDAWLNTYKDAQGRIEADASDFLKAEDSEGHRIDFHSLRHTCGTWLIQNGADAMTVQRIMRDSDIKLTLQTYGHLFPGAEAEAVARLRHAFATTPKTTVNGTDG